MLSKHNPQAVFTFLLNTLQTKFSHLLEGGKLNIADPKVVNQEAFKLLVNMVGTSVSGTPWTLKLKFQYMQFNDSMFCVRISKVKGCQFQMNL